MIIKNLYARICNLVPEPDCDTFGDDYEAIVWRDSRPIPAVDEIEAIDESASIPKHPKAILLEALQDMALDLGGGRIIQTRPQDQQNMQAKIVVINAGGSDLFIMKNNTVHPVTVAELEAAIQHGILEGSRLYDEYMAKL